LTVPWGTGLRLPRRGWSRGLAARTRRAAGCPPRPPRRSSRASASEPVSRPS